MYLLWKCSILDKLKRTVSLLGVKRACFLMFGVHLFDKL